MTISKTRYNKIKLLLLTSLIILASVFVYINFRSDASETVNGMTINGIVTNIDNEPIEDALILFMRGDTVASQAFSDIAGKYQVTLPEGDYNMQVITDDGLTDIESPLRVTKEDNNTTLEYNIDTIPDDNFEISPGMDETNSN